MREQLKDKFEDIHQSKDKFEVITKLDQLHTSFFSKYILLFSSFFLFNLFVLSVMGFATAVAFLLTGKVPEAQNIYFYTGAVGAAAFSVIFFKLMRITWKKFRKTKEKKLKLEI